MKNTLAALSVLLLLNGNVNAGALSANDLAAAKREFRSALKIGRAHV